MNDHFNSDHLNSFAKRSQFKLGFNFSEIILIHNPSVVKPV